MEIGIDCRGNRELEAEVQVKGEYE